MTVCKHCDSPAGSKDGPTYHKKRWFRKTAFWHCTRCNFRWQDEEDALKHQIGNIRREYKHGIPLE